MKLFINTIVLVFLILGCGENMRSKKNPPQKRAICAQKLYVETYNIYAVGGAIGGSVESDYLTDSTNFRIYVGSYDLANANYFYQCKADSIQIEKWSFEEDSKLLDASRITKKLLEKKILNLNDLKRSHKFE